ncbi:MAG TPA: methyltransferase domain-containing protein [Tepidisphaeraceae bacterium]|jgi:phosphatidylethanolamine/phosphatidyl-N-methylethanolamine N-methyltransferase
MQEASTRKIYDVQSMVYDYTFGQLVKKRIARAITHMNIQPGETVLDVGIGTGGSMSFYPKHARVMGVDLSSGMLREARKKIIDDDYQNITVFQGNALELPFEDSSFDHLFISHVISVVSQPELLVREAQRVAKEGAKIVILNHFLSTNRFVAMLEKWANPICQKIGWRSDLALADLVAKTQIEIDYRYKLRSVDLWETVVTTNTKSALALA